VRLPGWIALEMLSSLELAPEWKRQIIVPSC
jgi:hypothetical protein